MRQLLAWALVVGSILLAASSLVQYRFDQAEKAKISRLFEDSGLAEASPDLERRLAREPSAQRARLILARALLADAFKMTGLADLSSQELPRALESRMRQAEKARHLAAETLPTTPAAWQAAMILGGATYLQWSLSQDRRLLTSWRSWEAPLEQAMALAPGRPEPARLLVTAYLELWTSLSESKRERTKALLQKSFEDPPTFNRLIAAWLEVADDMEDAFRLIPSQPGAWARVQQILASRKQWDDYVEARARWEHALATDLEGRLEEAEHRLRGGDHRGARELFLEVASLAPPERRFRDLLSRALSQCPPGPASQATATRLHPWLDWTLQLYLYRNLPLDSVVVRRLAGLSGPLPPHEAALAALAAGRLAEAERYERSAQALWSEAWAPYGLVKTRLLVERGDLPEATARLEQVHRSWSDTAIYWLARRRLAEAEGHDRELARAASTLAELRRTRWEKEAWRRRGARWQLELLPTGTATGLSLVAEAVQTAGAVVEVRWDGANVGCQAMLTGRPMRIAVDVDDTLHLLELESVAGGPILPGPVVLLR